MFSKKVVMIIAVVFLIIVNITILTLSSKRRSSSFGVGHFAVSVTAPFQTVVSGTLHFARDLWENYFNLVLIAKENDSLRKELAVERSKSNHCVEIELTNKRLRRFFNFHETPSEEIIAAEVTGKDPSLWFKTIIIDKGLFDGVEKGLPVVSPEGVVGQIVNVSGRYSKVLLITDRNNAVDALVQQTRSRGIIKGSASGGCIFDYALRKDDVKIGDVIISSGLDGVYPKGLRIGEITEVVRRSSGIFQQVNVRPFVDFEKLEEVLILRKSQDSSNEGE